MRKSKKSLVVWLAASLAASLALTACAETQTPQRPAAEQSLSGSAEVLTGNSLRLAGRLLHLQGIAVPPPGASCGLPSGRAYDCGEISRTALLDLTAGAQVTCRFQTSRAAHCTAQGYDLSEGMVHTGWARSWPAHGGPYRLLEEAARAAGRGLWRGNPPEVWTAPPSG